MSDIRRDIEKAAKPKADFDMRDITWEDAAKGAGAIGIGALAGRAVGKRIRRAINDRRLPQHAMDVIKHQQNMRAITPSGTARFRKK